MTMQAAMLPDGRRLHLNHGPIDLIIEAFGGADQVRAAYGQAERRFDDILPVLVAELAALRTPVAAPRWHPEGPVARRMMAAVWPHRARFITPMAAVAGAVADEVLAALVAGRTLARAYVNNGGDIAFHLAPGESLTAAMVGGDDPGTARLTFGMPVRGIATSGWKGRSFSLGIADSVTVLAADAASADVAATLIANAVDVDHPAIGRTPATALDPDSDLAMRAVTVSVPPLDGKSVAAALDAGARAALKLEQTGHIRAAMLVLQQQHRVVGAATGLIGRRAA
jgi:ApbE superfamily uncharacterized protein (UPF0280 family)